MPSIPAHPLESPPCLSLRNYPDRRRHGSPSLSPTIDHRRRRLSRCAHHSSRFVRCRFPVRSFADRTTRRRTGAVQRLFGGKTSRRNDRVYRRKRTARVTRARVDEKRQENGRECKQKTARTSILESGAPVCRCVLAGRSGAER